MSETVLGTETDWMLVAGTIALAGLNAFVAALALGVFGGVIHPETAIIAGFAVLGCALMCAAEVITDG